MARRATSLPAAAKLPRYIPPMLAKIGQPFDSAEYLYEIKWDGTRALGFIEGGGYRLVNRRRLDMTQRYPEFGFLAGLPEGTILDGEVVVLQDGKPDFGLLQSREQARSPLKVRGKAQSHPATYLVFDLLYERGESLLKQPLVERQKRLRKLVKRVANLHFVLSEGIIGQGKAFFQKAVAQGLEGVMAKRLKSHYLPGQRTPAWIKIKRGELVHCVIVGFLPSGKDDFRSLILAAQEEGKLRIVGKVGTGFDAKLRARLNRLLYSRLRERPIVPCREKGKWIEPGLYCTVACMERTSGGELRAPAFRQLFVEGEDG